MILLNYHQNIQSPFILNQNKLNIYVYLNNIILCFMEQLMYSISGVEILLKIKTPISI